MKMTIRLKSSEEPKGQKKDGCPKREEFKSDAEYEKALKDWKASQAAGKVS